MKKEKICFFGGSFNPWHNGHRACVDLFQKSHKDDWKLILVPDNNPWKKNNEMLIEDKKEILKELQEHNPGIEIMDKFLLSNKQNPTYQWLSPLQIEKPETEFALLMGFDSFCSLPKWYESEALIKLLTKVFVASRQDSQEEKQRVLDYLSQFKEQDFVTFLGHHAYEELSSTAMRNQ